MTHQPIATAETFINIAKSASKCLQSIPSGDQYKDKRLTLVDLQISALGYAQDALMDEPSVENAANLVSGETVVVNNAGDNRPNPAP